MSYFGPWFGASIAGAGLIIRILRRRDPYARWIVVGGAALAVIGMLVPYTDSRVALPAEYTLFLRGRARAKAGGVNFNEIELVWGKQRFALEERMKADPTR